LRGVERTLGECIATPQVDPLTDIRLGLLPPKARADFVPAGVSGQSLNASDHAKQNCRATTPYFCARDGSRTVETRDSARGILSVRRKGLLQHLIWLRLNIDSMHRSSVRGSAIAQASIKKFDYLGLAYGVIRVKDYAGLRGISSERVGGRP
jgi:hypothetical protein